MGAEKMTYADDFTVDSMQELTDLIEKMGFVPFFANEIPGFSLEEHIAPKRWYGGSESFWDAWEWKGPVIRQTGCAYGKFLRNKAMYISAEWFPDFANYRRDGYDFDARYDDGLASYYDKELFELLDANAPILSKSLKQIGNYGKGGRKGLEGMITRLQKQCYVVISDFRYARDRYGNRYGWGIAEYSTPEKLYGTDFTDAVYRRAPEESYMRVLEQFQRILPEAEEAQIKRLLK